MYWFAHVLVCLVDDALYGTKREFEKQTHKIKVTAGDSGRRYHAVFAKAITYARAAGRTAFHGVIFSLTGAVVFRVVAPATAAPAAVCNNADDASIPPPAGIAKHSPFMRLLALDCPVPGNYGNEGLMHSDGARTMAALMHLFNAAAGATWAWPNAARLPDELMQHIADVADWRTRSALLRAAPSLRHFAAARVRVGCCSVAQLLPARQLWWRRPDWREYMDGLRAFLSTATVAAAPGAAAAAAGGAAADEHDHNGGALPATCDLQHEIHLPGEYDVFLSRSGPGHDNVYVPVIGAEPRFAVVAQVSICMSFVERGGDDHLTFVEDIEHSDTAACFAFLAGRK
jgi:hypothetical protein